MITPKPCRSCKAPILLARKAENNTSWTVLEAAEVDPARVYDASKVRILRGEQTAYRLEHLREALQMEPVVDHDGEQTPEDFPWHPVHMCEAR